MGSPIVSFGLHLAPTPVKTSDSAIVKITVGILIGVAVDYNSGIPDTLCCPRTLNCQLFGHRCSLSRGMGSV